MSLTATTTTLTPNKFNTLTSQRKTEKCEKNLKIALNQPQIQSSRRQKNIATRIEFNTPKHKQYVYFCVLVVRIGFWWPCYLVAPLFLFLALSAHSMFRLCIGIIVADTTITIHDDNNNNINTLTAWE